MPPSPSIAWLASSLERYWPRQADLVLALPIPNRPTPIDEASPPRVEIVPLPDWAADLGVGGGLLVPSFAVATGPGEPWRRVDWWAAAFWFLNASAERSHEDRHGPIHSYSLRLQGWDSRMWRHAWVNRIGLLLRRWAARRLRREECEVFDPLPRAEIIVTHDVDAVEKTWAIRFKQSAFHAFNSARSLLRGQPLRALAKGWAATRFGLGSGTYWNFETIARLEDEAGVRSHFNVYAAPLEGRSPRQRLIDPSYDPRRPRIRECLADLARRGWTVGLHQSFESWSDVERMQIERRRLEEALDRPVTSCRQHWLRFSWRDTWKTQQASGLRLDTTLGFNDRPAFRNAAALAWRPWDPDADAPMSLTAMPMVLMDSHLFDYSQLDDADRRRWIADWLGEIRAVHGAATVLWHPHVLSPDYGWSAGFSWLLDEVRAA